MVGCFKLQKVCPGGCCRRLDPTALLHLPRTVQVWILVLDPHRNDLEWVIIPL